MLPVSSPCPPPPAHSQPASDAPCCNRRVRQSSIRCHLPLAASAHPCVAPAHGCSGAVNGCSAPANRYIDALNRSISALYRCSGALYRCSDARNRCISALYRYIGAMYRLLSAVDARFARLLRESAAVAGSIRQRRAGAEGVKACRKGPHAGTKAVKTGTEGVNNGGAVRRTFVRQRGHAMTFTQSREEAGAGSGSCTEPGLTSQDTPCVPLPYPQDSTKVKAIRGRACCRHL